MDSKLIEAYENVIQDLYGDGGNPDAIASVVMLLANRKNELEHWHLFKQEPSKEGQ